MANLAIVEVMLTWRRRGGLSTTRGRDASDGGNLLGGRSGRNCLLAAGAKTNIRDRMNKLVIASLAREREHRDDADLRPPENGA